MKEVVSYLHKIIILIFFSTFIFDVNSQGINEVKIGEVYMTKVAENHFAIHNIKSSEVFSEKAKKLSEYLISSGYKMVNANTDDDIDDTFMSRTNIFSFEKLIKNEIKYINLMYTSYQLKKLGPESKVVSYSITLFINTIEKVDL